MKILNISPATKQNFIQQKTTSNSPSNTKNISTQDFIYNSACLSQINFKGTKINLSNSQKQAIDFGVELYSKILTDENLDIFEETKNFLAQNNFENIEIKPLSQATQATKNTSGGFSPDFNEELEFCGGTLYLDTPPNSNDKKAIQRYISVLAHELQHAFEARDNQPSEIFKKYDINKKDMNVILGFVSAIMPYATGTIMQDPLQYCIDNHKEYGVAIYEARNMNSDIKKYGAIYPAKSSRNIDINTVYRAFNGEGNFYKIVEEFCSNLIKCYNNSPGTIELRDSKYHKAAKEYCIYALKDEAKAHQINSEIHKKIYALDGRFYSLNDLIPLAFDAFAEKLEQISL